MPYIYKIQNKINGKLYIGKTSGTIEERFKQHIRDSRKTHREKRPLYSAFNKYGTDNFIISEIERVDTEEEACQREMYWIDKLRTYVGFQDCNGYNATLGGDSKRYYNYEEIANKYKEIQNVGKVTEIFNCSADTVRVACRECNVKILSGAEASKKFTSKKVNQLNKDTKEKIATYDSIKDAYRALERTPGGGIGRACKKGNICLGYKWEYAE